MTAPTTPRLTVDAVITDPSRGVLLVRRAFSPFAGCWALPGGFVEPAETCEQACLREVHEETGLRVVITGLVGVFSGPGRDPRGPTASVVYCCSVLSGTARGGDDADAAQWWAELKGVPLAFDHAHILAAAGFLPPPR